MISCTEFIPLYSEFFKFLEKRGGKDAVMNYWIHISDTSIGDRTNPNSLAYKCERLGGYEGAKAYWGHTLTEEACDLYEITNDKLKYYYSHMRHCPSRGMLNEICHIEPYHDYCEHCKVIYSRVLQRYGIIYERDHSKIDRAECSSILYEKGNKPSFDYTVPTEDCEVVDLKSEDNKYLHRDFHLLGDNALKYCGDNFGSSEVISFLRDFTKTYYAPIIEKIKREGLSAAKAWLERTYELEEASALLHTEMTDSTLSVTVERCPAIEYMRSLGKEPSEYFIEETRTVYATIAEEARLSFKLISYGTDGEAEFVFEEKMADLLDTNTEKIE